MGGFRGSVETEVFHLAANPYCGLIFAISVKSDAKQPGCVASMRPFLILLINMLRYVAQIGKSIVGRVAIDVIDFVARPAPSLDKPCDAVDGVLPAF